jgi:hypothetical protein
MNDKKDDHYSNQDAQRRTEAALRAAFNTPPKPQSEMKLGKRRGKSGKSPGKRKAVKNSSR